MPSHIVHGTLTQLNVMHDGVPWGYSRWQRNTDVKHGLFPDDDSLLPEGWTRETDLVVATDQPWGTQEEHQVIGRALRQPQPQEETVVTCTLFAADTPDMVLSSLVREKKSSMDAFLDKEKGKEMYGLLSGKS